MLSFLKGRMRYTLLISCILWLLDHTGEKQSITTFFFFFLCAPWQTRPKWHCTFISQLAPLWRQLVSSLLRPDLAPSVLVSTCSTWSIRKTQSTTSYLVDPVYTLNLDDMPQDTLVWQRHAQQTTVQLFTLEPWPVLLDYPEADIF